MQRIATTVFVISSFLMQSGFAQHANCIWAGKIYADNDLKLNGGVCQTCTNGKWIDRKVPCDQCRPEKGTLGETDHKGSDTDCVYESKDDGPKIFSDGARMVNSQKQYKKCSASQWVDSPPTDDQICREPK